MLSLPRLAVGTIQPEAGIRAVLWALIEALRQKGLQVQCFLSQACFFTYHGTATASGRNPRHLDSWLMSPGLCRELFLHGAEDCDLAVVQGKYAPALVGVNGAGGTLEALCEWLDLPRLVVLDISRIKACRASQRPQQADALLLDRVRDADHLARLTTDLEALWGLPVLGALEELPALRAEMDALPPGTRPKRELCQELCRRLLKHTRPQQLLELASRSGAVSAPRRVFAAEPDRARPVVALAYDDSMNCYFPDTLDVLEMRGATVVDFSPLRDERLPEGTDIVYLGCGHPDRYAAQLGGNHCMRLALHDHLRNGGRVYAEGGGLAYLCQQMEAADGQWQRMVGIFPAVARIQKNSGPPTPVEVTLDCDTWLGPRGVRLRGYRSPCWRLEPAGKLAGCVSQGDQEYGLVKSGRALGSLLHLNFAAQPGLLAGFFRLRGSRPERLDPWTYPP